MSPLPRKGELVETMEILNQRIAAVFDGDPRQDGPSMRGDMTDWRALFGDLFDMDEMQELATRFAAGLVPDLIGGAPLLATYCTAFAQGAALGAMAERRRWEAEK